MRLHLVALPHAHDFPQDKNGGEPWTAACGCVWYPNSVVPCVSSSGWAWICIKPCVCHDLKVAGESRR